jgi:hypothetical protein
MRHPRGHDSDTNVSDSTRLQIHNKYTTLTIKSSLNQNLDNLKLCLKSSKPQYESGFEKPSASWYFEGINQISHCLFNIVL